ncbi:hypothetical protein, partial [Paenibacillus hubeiensis]|uniref:hypothetical protein n=1 Tax=Paenibacillus hubeiensis TaxID=3077330 RepID=UPI0031B9DBAB
MEATLSLCLLMTRLFTIGVGGQEHIPIEIRYISDFFIFIGTSSCPEQRLEPVQITGICLFSLEQSVSD